MSFVVEGGLMMPDCSRGSDIFDLLGSWLRAVGSRQDVSELLGYL
ncbi:hypothetical protein [Cytobacillus purgationiresistens]|uniref:Uncharacterized protein n=1 Tax=Cytobacillus purgationiresistens TaxID=863449 RepID=A0ABU0ARM6_9BACI|nr:hypothetical protein [Cytobacillus purgationiresistens]MDQ0273929.1 hypothetical protein [Cytobacillus purgationiresistens]